MENKINYKDVPACFTHCIQADCQMANHCLRQLAMQALPDSERAVRILNPQLTKATIPTIHVGLHRPLWPQSLLRAS